MVTYLRIGIIVAIMLVIELLTDSERRDAEYLFVQEFCPEHDQKYVYPTWCMAEALVTILTIIGWPLQVYTWIQSFMRCKEI